MKRLIILILLMLNISYAAKKCAPESPSLINFACENDRTWVIGVGVEAEYGNVADASKEKEFEIEPGAIFHASTEDFHFFFNGQESGVRWYASERLNFMAGIRFEPGREEEDDPVLLKGQGNSDDEVMRRLEVRYDILGNWNFWAGASSLLGDESIGELHIFAIGIGINKMDKFDLELMISKRYGTSAFINKDFGVDSVQSSRNGLPIYSAENGHQSDAITLIGRYDYSDKIKLLFEFGYDKYASRLKDSPIIKKGQDNEFEIGGTFLYLF